MTSQILRTRHILYFAILATATPLAALAQEPAGTARVITYQGKLTDTVGNALTGSYDFVFSLSDAGADADASTLWSETHQAVSVENGFYHVGLGDDSLLSPDIFAAADLFVEVQVRRADQGDFETLAPRLRLGSVGHAFNTTLLAGNNAAFYQNAANLTGTLDDSRLSANVARLSAANQFAGAITVGAGLVRMGDGTPAAAGALAIANGSNSPPALRFNAPAARWEFSNDGIDYLAVGSSGQTTSDAGALTLGTLGDARLSANVPLLNATANLFTGAAAFEGGIDTARLDATDINAAAATIAGVLSTADLQADAATIRGALSADSGQFAGVVSVSSLSAAGFTVDRGLVQSVLDVGALTVAGTVTMNNARVTAGLISLGDGAALTTPLIVANVGAANPPAIRFNADAGVWELSNNGTLFSAIGAEGQGTTDASVLVAGTLPDARLSPNVTLLGNAVNGPGQLVALGSSGVVPMNSVDGAAVADGSITGADLAPGTLSSNEIADGSITTTKLASAAVTNAALADGSITSNKIQPGAVNSGEIAPGSIGSSHIAPGSVGSSHIADGSITGADLAPGTLSSNEIADGSITTTKLASAAVTNTALADGSITSNKIQPGAVNSGEIAPGSIGSSHIAPGSVG
ncbi:MAG: hypothetical protein HY719_12865, partial [Planctomycetes bacterium]|nr:hypothetical protein [Planctomycetota bacterium]